jgi:WD40 repeat protein
MRIAAVVAGLLLMRPTSACADDPVRPETSPLLAEVGTRTLLFARDGKALLSLGANGSQLWDVRTGKLLRKYDDFPPRRFGELPLAAPFAVSPDCRLVALGGLEEADLLIREVATGKEISRLKGRVQDERANVTLAFSSDARLLALGGYPGNIHLWDTSTGKELHLLRWRNMDHSEMTFSRDGKILAAGSGDGRIGLWDVASGKLLRSMKAYRAHQPVVKLAFSPDGKMLASHGLNGRFRHWDVASGKQVLEIPEEEYAFDVVFSPNSRLIASWGADNSIRLREVVGGKQRRLEGHSETITSVAFSPDGKILASASSDHTLRLWDVETGRERFRHKQRSEFVECVVFSPDGRILASVPGPENKIHFWDPVTGKEIGR